MTLVVYVDIKKRIEDNDLLVILFPWFLLATSRHIQQHIYKLLHTPTLLQLVIGPTKPVIHM